MLISINEEKALHKIHNDIRLTTKHTDCLYYSTHMGLFPILYGIYMGKYTVSIPVGITFLAARRTFCVITLYALEIKALFFKARFAANLDDYKCVACCKRVYSCGETIKKHEVSFFCPILYTYLTFPP